MVSPVLASKRRRNQMRTVPIVLKETCKAVEKLARVETRDKHDQTLLEIVFLVAQTSTWLPRA